MIKPGAQAATSGLAGPSTSSRMRPDVAVRAPVRVSSTARLLVIHLLQLPAIGLVLVSPYAAAWWCAALWSSLVTCAGTDSGWRWWNRLLVAEAIGWLTAALVFGT